MKRTTFVIMILVASIIALLGANIVWITRNNNLRKEIQEVKANSDMNHEAASLLMDFIRCTRDNWEEQDLSNAGAELEESFHEYFQDLSLGIYNTQYIKNIKDFENYSWCY